MLYTAALAPGAMYEFWSLTESDGETTRSGVTRAYADIDNPEGAGTVHVYLAGPDGEVSGAIKDAVDADLQVRRGISTILTTSTATKTTAAPTETVWVSGVLPADAQAEEQALLDEFIAALPIGGKVVGGERGVFAEDLEDTIREATGVARARITSGGHTMTASEVAVGNWDNLRRQHRERLVAELETELETMKQNAGRHTKRACELLSSARFGRYLRQTKTGLLRLDRKAVSDAARYDGKWVITSNDDTLTAEDLALGYKQLMRVEECWRKLKSGLRMRPVFHWRPWRIHAHISIAALALLLERIAELRLSDTWRNIAAAA